MEDTLLTIEQAIETWDGLGIVIRRDHDTGAWIFIVLDNDTLGSPVGGTRVRVYSRPADGLRDAMRLARGMTYKWAALGFDAGGGKAVLALDKPIEGEARTGLLRRYGGMLRLLKGAFATGRDLGTTDDDMLVIAREAPYVHGVDLTSGGVEDPGPYTAAGVHASMRTICEFLDGNRELEGQRILVQGLGAVGQPLSRLLIADGARVVLSDVDAHRVERLSGELDAECVAPDAVYTYACDVYAPCAVGATLNSETIPHLRCRAVVGSANNQLDRDADADELHARGILYAPDFVANGGGALAFGLKHRGEADEGVIAGRLEGIGDALGQLLVEAREHDESPLHAARRRVDEVLKRGRPQNV